MYNHSHLSKENPVMQNNNVPSNNVLGIVLSVFSISTSFIFLFLSLYISEKHLGFLILVLVCGFPTTAYLAFQIGKGAIGKNMLAWSFLSILIIFTCGVFYYFLIIKSR